MAEDKIYLQTQPWNPFNIPVAKSSKNPTITSSKANSFADLLQQKTTQVKFSQHATERMQSRNLQLSQQDMTKLNAAVEKIAQKGSRESLVYLNDMALVVSIKNKTVITAMDGSSAKDNIFTNIDSAVIL